MKQIVTVVITAFTMATTQAQKQHEIMEVVAVDSSRTAQDLYTTAKRWFVDTFGDSREVIHLDDPANHTIVGKGAFKFDTHIFLGSATRKGYFHYTLAVECKDGRYRVRMYDFDHKGSANVSSTGYYPAHDMGILYDGDTCVVEFRKKQVKFGRRVCTEEVWPQVLLNERTLLNSLEQAMKAKETASPKTPVSSDW